MKESVTYQGIVAEGMVKARQEDLLYFGELRFGPPGEAVAAALTGVSDLGRLTCLMRRLPNAASWDELLAAP